MGVKAGAWLLIVKGAISLGLYRWRHDSIQLTRLYHSRRWLLPGCSAGYSFAP